MNVPRSIKEQFPRVTKVFEARTPVDVQVTARDNQGGKPGDAMNCAMARAVCREFKAEAAVIGTTYSYVISGNTAVRYKTPVTLQREMTSFDRNHDFRPGRYGLSAMSPSQTLGAKRKANKANKKRRDRSATNWGKRKGAKHEPKRRIVTAHTQGLRVIK